MRHFRHRWVAKIDFTLLDFSKKMADFDDFKAFVSNFLYYSLYKGKLEVITHPQCDVRFFIRPLVFILTHNKVFLSHLNFNSSQIEN